MTLPPDAPNPRPTPMADNGLGVRRHGFALFVALVLSAILHLALFYALGAAVWGAAPGAGAPADRLTPAALPPLEISTLLRVVGAEEAPTPALREPDAAEAARRSAEETAAKAAAAPLRAPGPAAPALPDTPPAPPTPPPAAAAPTPPRQAVAALPEHLGPADADRPEPRWVVEADQPLTPLAPDLLPSAEAIAPTPAPFRPEAPGAGGAPGGTAPLGDGEPGAAALPPPPAPAAKDGEPATLAAAARALADEAAERASSPAVRETPFQAIDERLSLTLAVSDADPGHRYFRLEILRKPDSELPVMPKDVVFIQDVSGSIGETRLAQGKAALKAALAETLRAGDRFNVFAFRDVTLTPSDAWLTYDPATRLRAEAFIDSLRAIGNTDLFLLLQDILTLPRDPARPLVAVVVTDGEPTVGVTGTARIIGEFTRMNRGRVAVYTFGAKKRDPYFLDMLCYANRGENTTATGRAADLAAELAPVFDSIRNPVLKDPSLTFDASSRGEIHPRHLTHLYADRPLVVYGRVPKNVRHVTCQLRGLAADAAYDALFAFDLDAAPRAQADLRQAWARRAMFDLLAQYAENPSAALLARIDAFAREHGLPNPYRRR